MPDNLEYEPSRIEPAEGRRLKIAGRIVAGMVVAMFGLMMVFADLVGFETRWKDYLIGALCGTIAVLLGYVAVTGKTP
jgi:hypothetical protein